MKRFQFYLDGVDGNDRLLMTRAIRAASCEESVESYHQLLIELLVQRQVASVKLPKNSIIFFNMFVTFKRFEL